MTDQKKVLQAYYTPLGVAAEVIRIAEVAGKRVLEPSAGHAALADQARKSGAAEVVCVEINPQECAYLRAAGFETHEQDFLTFFPEEKFDCIVMNPPFAKLQDIKHVAHAYEHCLAPGGSLVAVMPDSQTRAQFQKMIAKLDYAMPYDIARGAFSESGTEVKTIILSVAKNALPAPKAAKVAAQVAPESNAQAHSAPVLTATTLPDYQMPTHQPIRVGKWTQAGLF